MTMLQSCVRFAELSNRHDPTLHDMCHTFQLLGLTTPDLSKFAKRATGAADKRVSISPVLPSQSVQSWEAPTSSFLPSDDEDSAKEEPSSTWATLMHDIVPNHLPPPPPRHCWMSTPVYATEVLSDMPVLQLVNRKLDNARLVESSLRQLIRNTDKAAPPVMWVPAPPAVSGEPSADALEAPVDAAPEGASAPSDKLVDADVSVMSVDEAADSGVETLSAPRTTDENAVAESAALDPAAVGPPTTVRRGVLPRAINYKASWYAAVASTDSKLPTANLYTARLRGTMDDTTRRPRRYVV